MRLPLASSLAVSLLATGALARAQAEPLPPLPPPSAAPGPAAAPSESPPAPPAPPPEPPPRVIYAAPPPPEYVYQPPPPGPGSMSEAEPVHAPKYSLWLGGRLGVLLYNGSVYQDPNTGNTERIGSFVTNGLAVEADVGARISRRYIPYLALELGLVGPGSRFQGTQATAGTSFLGVGFRFLAGDVSSISFASDISFGFRKLQVSNDNSTWTASSFEFLRLGLGADIRFTSYFTISPMITLAGGSFADSTGSVNFAAGQNPPGTPSYVNNGFNSQAVSSYFSIILGCGAHFDLLSSHE